jgi:hypothetical protein
MDAINVCLGLFSVHYQLKIYFKADFSSSESHYLPKTLLNISIQTCLSHLLTIRKRKLYFFSLMKIFQDLYIIFILWYSWAFKGYSGVFLGILGYSWVNVWTRKIVDTGAKELPLIHMYINSNLIYDCVRIGCTKTHTFV